MRSFFLSVVCLALTTSATPAAIIVGSGMLSPAYPASNPDPWIIPGVISLDGTLIVDGSSRVETGSLEFAAATSALFVDAGTFIVGTLPVGADKTLYYNLQNAAAFVSENPGGSTDRSTTVIALDSGSSFTATGDQTFGGDSSSVSFGPAGDASNVVIAKASVADTAQGILAAAIVDPAVIPVTGHDTSFKIIGHADLGGSSSDALMLFNCDSSFEVTGNLDGVGNFSTLACIVTNSVFETGGTVTFVDGDGSSVGGFFIGSTVDIGGDWKFMKGVGSHSTLNATSTNFTLGGNFDNAFGNNSATEVNLDTATFDIDGDFLIGNLESSGVGITLLFEDSTITATGGLVAEVDRISVMAFDVRRSTFDLGGDFVFLSNGDESVTTLGISQGDVILGGSYVVGAVGVDRGSTITIIQDVDLDITDDFRLGYSGNGSDSQMVMIDIRGTVGRDLTLSGNRDAGSLHNMVIVGLDLEVGRDMSFLTTPPSPGSNFNAFGGGLKLSVGRNLIFGLGFYATINDSIFDVTGTATVAGELFTSETEFVGNLSVVSSGILHPRYVVDEVFGLKSRGDLTLADAATLVIDISDTAQSSGYDFFIHEGSSPLVLNGQLSIRFSGGAQSGTSASQSFTALRSNRVLAGSFDNIASGARLATADGHGSFLVTYVGATAVTLSAFQPTAPPAAQITRMTPVPGGLLLEWLPFGDGINYSVETSPRMEDGTWDQVVNTPQLRAIVSSTAGSQRFYRVTSF